MLEINGTFKFSKKSLSGEDYFVLSQMYLPLIGIDSFSVYITLNNLLVEETTVKKVLDILSFDSLGLLEKALNKLEAIGLVKEYNNKTKGVYLCLMAPLSARNFLNNSLLQKYLITQLGEVEYENLRAKVFNKPIKGYEEVTKSFDDVFKPSKKKNINTIFNVNEDTEIDNIRIKNKNFDYLIFKMQFNDNELKQEVLDDEGFQEQILKISYQYQLNEYEMKEAVMKAITTGKDLKFEDISRNAGYIYQNKVPEAVVSFQEKNVEVYDNEFTSDDLAILEACKGASINDFLAAVSGGKGSVGDIRDYNRLAETTGLPVSVINMLIFYLSTMDGPQNFQYAYLDKVIRNWMKAKVRNAEDALRLMRAKNKPKGKTIAKPEWMKDEEDDKAINNTELSDEEKLKGEALRKKLFGGNK